MSRENGQAISYSDKARENFDRIFRRKGNRISKEVQEELGAATKEKAPPLWRGQDGAGQTPTKSL
jgi:hypothetical protein